MFVSVSDEVRNGVSTLTFAKVIANSALPYNLTKDSSGK